MDAQQIINAVQKLYNEKFLIVDTIEDARRVAKAHEAIYLIAPDVHDNRGRGFGPALSI